MYYVIIEQDNDVAELLCATYGEALQVKRSFVNYGQCQSVTIEEIKEERNEVQ